MRIAIVVTHADLVVAAERWARYLRSQYAALPYIYTPQELLTSLAVPTHHDMTILLTMGDFDVANGKLAQLDYTTLAVVNYSGAAYSSKAYHSPLHHKFQAGYVGMRHGWTFCVQYDTFLDCLTTTSRTSWLPICADHLLMTPSSEIYEHTCDILLAGADSDRLAGIETRLQHAGYKIGRQTRFLPGDYRLACLSAKFIIVSAGSPYRDYDVMPEVVDALAVGKSVLTNVSDSLPRLFDKPTYLRTFRDENEIVSLANELMGSVEFLSGRGARERVEHDLNYSIRAEMLLSTLAVKVK